jgi:hypothetical protein
MKTPRTTVLEINADNALSKPYLMILLLAGIAGAMDAVDFREYGVFTANQAGNLVLVWERLTTDPALALLSLFSLVGCAVGIVVVILMRLWFPYFVQPSGSRSLLFVSAVLLIVTALAGRNLAKPVRELTAGELEIGTEAWWAAAASVSSSAMALAVMGTIFVMVGSDRAQIIAGTGPFIDTVRYSVASLFTRDRDWVQKFKAIVWFPIAWTLGAAVASLIPVNRGAIAALCALTICGIAVASRRVGSIT